MKIAEALIRRASLLKRRENIRKRIRASARMFVGGEPIEDIEDLLQEGFKLLDELENLVERIGRTNQQVRFDDDQTLAALLVRRDTLTKKHALIEHAAEHATIDFDAFSEPSEKIQPSVDLKKINRSMNQVAKEIRELDILIQQANWTHELVD